MRISRSVERSKFLSVPAKHSKQYNQASSDKNPHRHYHRYQIERLNQTNPLENVCKVESAKAENKSECKVEDRLQFIIRPNIPLSSPLNAAL